MKSINISGVIADQRRIRGITQEQLAEYVGVSKASVSKWETGLSYPDITFLPILAAYFNITLDELMGYTPQLTKAEIRNLYLNLAGKFAQQPFETVISECRGEIKKYYACFPLLLQMAVLLCNHWMLAADQETQKAVLNEAVQLCEKIITESNDIGLVGEAVAIASNCYLMMGNPQQVLKLLGDTVKPLTNSSIGVSQAYYMMGNLTQYEYIVQVALYQHTLMLISDLTALLKLANEQFDETVKRLMTVAEVFDLENLHPNTMAMAYLHIAQGYCHKQQNEHAIKYLESYTNLCVDRFFPISIHGDQYFHRLDVWIKEFDLGNNLPRDEAVIKQSMIQELELNPVFSSLKEDQRFKQMIETLKYRFQG